MVQETPKRLKYELSYANCLQFYLKNLPLTFSK